MAIDLTVPQLGESIVEAVVSKWNKQVGDAVKADEPLVVLETDKVTVDVPSPAGGSLMQIAHQEGDRGKVGDVLGSTAPGGQQASAASTPAAPAQSPAPAANPQAAPPAGPGAPPPASPSRPAAS